MQAEIARHLGQRLLAEFAVAVREMTRNVLGQLQ